MEKMLIIFGMVLFITAGCQKVQTPGQENLILHAQYIEPGAEEPFEGERTFSYDSGEQRQKIQYTNGYPEVVETFYRNGSKRTKLIFADGGKGDAKTHTEWFKSGHKKFESEGNLTREWYENGQLKAEVHYSDSELHGVTKIWYEDGTLKGKENYFQGELDGERVKWNKDGNQIVSETYREGELIVKD